MRARAVDRAVRPVHGSTVERPLKYEGVRDLNRPREIQSPGRTQAKGGGDAAGEWRRSTGARRRWPWTAFPATVPTTSWCKTKRGRLRT
jgi:hypothetical protein